MKYLLSVLLLTFSAGAGLAQTVIEADRVEAGRIVLATTPLTFDLSSNSLAVAGIIPLSSTVSVPSSKTVSLIRLGRLSGEPNVFNVGPSAIAFGLYSSLTADADSSPSSNLYSVTSHVTNSGPGSTKGLHAAAFGSGQSTGVVIAGNFQIQPVSTSSSGSSAIWVALTGNVNNVANGIGIHSTGARMQYGIGSFVAPVPYNMAAYQTWMAADSSPWARAFQVLNSTATEVAYIHQDGTINTAEHIKVDGTKVLGNQCAAIPDSDGSASDNARAINALLACARSHGLVAP